MTPDSILSLSIAIGAAALVAAVSRRIGFLNTSGAAAAFVLGSVVFASGGIAWSTALLTFFVLSSVLSKLTPKKRSDTAFDAAFEKGSVRDAGQVWANGGIAGVVALLHLISPTPALYTAYLGALAAAAADTWATEIGKYGTGGVLSLRTFRSVVPGTSGGVSVLGSFGGMLGALTVALSGGAFATPVFAVGLLLTVVAAGTAGMFADSLSGALVQAQYRCTVCNAVTERTQHCDTPARLIQGYAWMNNDAVNTVCCVVGAVCGYVLPSVMR